MVIAAREVSKLKLATTGKPDRSPTTLCRATSADLSKGLVHDSSPPRPVKLTDESLTEHAFTTMGVLAVEEAK